MGDCVGLEVPSKSEMTGTAGRCGPEGRLPRARPQGPSAQGAAPGRGPAPPLGKGDWC